MMLQVFKHYREQTYSAGKTSRRKKMMQEKHDVGKTRCRKNMTQGKRDAGKHDEF